jgi:hypothetical protein
VPEPESSSLCGRFLSRPIQPCAIRSHSSRSNSDFVERACFSASAACRRYSSSRFIAGPKKGNQPHESLSAVEIKRIPVQRDDSTPASFRCAKIADVAEQKKVIVALYHRAVRTVSAPICIRHRIS